MQVALLKRYFGRPCLQDNCFLEKWRDKLGKGHSNATLQRGNGYRNKQNFEDIVTAIVSWLFFRLHDCA